jgi:hypothetical protein
MSLVNVAGGVKDFDFVDLQHLDAIIAITANSYSWWNAI